MTKPDFYTVPDAAKKLGITDKAVYLAIEKNRLESVTFYGKILIPATALAKYKPAQVKQKAGFARAKKKEG